MVSFRLDASGDGVAAVAAPGASVIAAQRIALPSVDRVETLSDAELQSRQREIAAVRRRVDHRAAVVAAEIARRSALALGHDGLAQRHGARTPERLVERLAGVSPGEARAMIRVGERLSRADAAIDAGDGSSPARDALSEAVASGELSVLAADAIGAGLGEPDTRASAGALADAACFLLTLAPELPLPRLAAQARALRDAIDADGVAEREQLLRERRFLRLSPQPDGMTRVAGLLDPESAAIVGAAFDQVTSPRRGGPRFIDPAAAARSRALVDDPRSTEQLLLDAFVEVVRIASAADDGRVFAQRRPAVTVHVDRTALDSGVGVALLEGQTAASSVQTAERLACGAGAIPVLFDGDDAIDVGRTQRLFTPRQRVALAARDGGCRWRGCDRPPSWCESHHIDQWVRDGGRTDLADGMLLCRFHHLFVHNHGWRIRRHEGTFVAHPPPGSSSLPIELPSQSVIRQLHSREHDSAMADCPR